MHEIEEACERAGVGARRGRHRPRVRPRPRASRAGLRAGADRRGQGPRPRRQRPAAPEPLDRRPRRAHGVVPRRRRRARRARPRRRHLDAGRPRGGRDADHARRLGARAHRPAHAQRASPRSARAAARPAARRSATGPTWSSASPRCAAANMTLQAIADQLNAEGVPTLRGGAMWRPSSVQAALGYRRPGTRGARATSSPLWKTGFRRTRQAVTQRGSHVNRKATYLQAFCRLTLRSRDPHHATRRTSHHEPLGGDVSRRSRLGAVGRGARRWRATGRCCDASRRSWQSRRWP